MGVLGSGYLSAEKTGGQPFCGDKEGWGPLSKYRYDFTPCFMDVWVSIVAIFGILSGAVAIWWLVRRKQKAEVAKDWHFWTKQVCMLSPFLSGSDKVGILNQEADVNVAGIDCGDRNLSSSPTCLPNH